MVGATADKCEVELLREREATKAGELLWGAKPETAAMHKKKVNNDLVNICNTDWRMQQSVVATPDSNAFMSAFVVRSSWLFPLFSQQFRFRNVMDHVIGNSTDAYFGTRK